MLTQRRNVTFTRGDIPALWYVTEAVAFAVHELDKGDGVTAEAVAQYLGLSNKAAETRLAGARREKLVYCAGRIVDGPRRLCRWKVTASSFATLE